MHIWDWDNYYKQERRMVGKNGAEYLFCSADDPESLRGPNASGLWLDEAQDMDELAYRNARGGLRQHGIAGWVSATFTPSSPDHWTSLEFIKDDPDTAFFRASLLENRFVSQKYKEMQLKNFAASPLMLRREVHGECVYLEGADWSPEYFEGVEIKEWPERKRDSILVISLDSSLGDPTKKAGDYAAFVIDLWQDGIMYLDADMRTGQDSSVIAQTGIELWKQYKPDYFVVEKDMGQHLLIAEMHRLADEQKIPMAITPIDTEKKNKMFRIRKLTPYVSRRQFRFLDTAKSGGSKILLDQMRSFGVGKHDDGPDSLAYNVDMLVKATTGMVLPPRSVGFSPMGMAI
jgi:predicted phage terminase large subunit-like protein